MDNITIEDYITNDVFMEKIFGGIYHKIKHPLLKQLKQKFTFTTHCIQELKLYQMKIIHQWVI